MICELTVKKFCKEDNWKLKAPRKPLSQNSKDKISAKCSARNLGRHWYNNGIKNVFAYKCPKGFIRGRK